MVSSHIELSINVRKSSDLTEVAADATFQGNLKIAIAETVDVDPKTVSISSVIVGNNGKLLVNYDVVF